MRSYAPAIIVSFIGHALLITLVVWGWEFSDHKTTEVKKPSYIKASLVELKPKVKPKAETKKKPAPKPKPKPKPKKDDSKKRAEEKKKQQQLAEKKRREAEQQRKNQLAKKKAEEKRKEQERKEKERKAAEEKRRLEQQQQAELERQALAKALAAEQAQLEAEKQAAEDAATVQSYLALIADKVERSWSRPASARNGMSVTLRIHLVPTGQVVTVDVLESSGNNAFDRSAVQAVKKADRFPELQDLPSRIFEQQFRSLRFVFTPEDLRQ